MALTERAFTIPEIMLLAGTRVALGAGLGLLISDRLTKDQRKAAGWALLAVGVLTTIPIVTGVLAKAPVAGSSAVGRRSAAVLQNVPSLAWMSTER
jgi:hypothetical protein